MEEKKLKIPYICMRVLTLLSFALMFFPSLSPARFITQAGQAKIRGNASLFTSAVSYKRLVDGLGLAFRTGKLKEWCFIILSISCVALLLGVVCVGAAMCMSVGNLKLKNMSKIPLIIGLVIQVLGISGIVASYFLVLSTMNRSSIVTMFPIGIPIYIIIVAVTVILGLYLVFATPKCDPSEKAEMPTKYQLFLMLFPFLLLTFAFSYLPLFSWRYAFFDYTAGGTLSAENFVGLKWFKLLVSERAYAMRLVRVLTNTLAMSFLGIITSWVPMAFALFLTEIKSTRFKRFVQLFTTVPNFISWVLVYAIAFAIFNTDGFINTILSAMGKNVTTNYLLSSDYMWIKMLLWGIWKSLGWSAIIYISGISVSTSSFMKQPL